MSYKSWRFLLDRIGAASEIPDSALERGKYIDSESDLTNLTIYDVQNGDTVIIRNTDPVEMYLVVDDNKLGTRDAFQKYPTGGSSIHKYAHSIRIRFNSSSFSDAFTGNYVLTGDVYFTFFNSNKSPYDKTTLIELLKSKEGSMDGEYPCHGGLDNRDSSDYSVIIPYTIKYLNLAGKYGLSLTYALIKSSSRYANTSMSITTDVFTTTSGIYVKDIVTQLI